MLMEVLYFFMVVMLVLLVYRTHYYTAMEQTIEKVYRSKQQCCNGWQQLNGEMGCMFSKYNLVLLFFFIPILYTNNSCVIC